MKISDSQANDFVNPPSVTTADQRRINEGKERNRQVCADVLANISTLQSHPVFGWFYKKVIEEPYFELKEKIDSDTLSGEELNVAHKLYLQAKKRVTWIIDQEIESRRALNPADAKIEILEKRLREL